MIIDTDKLRQKITDFERDEAARLDQQKDDRAAMKALTAAETRSIKREEAIAEVERLAQMFG